MIREIHIVFALTSIAMLAACGQSKLYAHEFFDESYAACGGNGTGVDAEAQLKNLTCLQTYLKTYISNVRRDEQGKVKDEVLDLNWSIENAEKRVAKRQAQMFRKANLEKCKPELDNVEKNIDPFTAKLRAENRYQKCLDTGKRQ